MKPDRTRLDIAILILLPVAWICSGVGAQQIQIDTTWECEHKSCILVEEYLHPGIIYFCACTEQGPDWISDWIDVAICRIDTTLVFHEPITTYSLRQKLDTVRVDTVDWEEVANPDSLYRAIRMDRDSLNMYILVPDSIWQPQLKYTVDTTYYLTPEQVMWIEDQGEIVVGGTQ